MAKQLCWFTTRYVDKLWEQQQQQLSATWKVSAVPKRTTVGLPSQKARGLSRSSTAAQQHNICNKQHMNHVSLQQILAHLLFVAVQVQEVSTAADGLQDILSSSQATKK